MSISDLNTVTDDPFAGKVYDVCICGAGPAGITLARKLSKQFDVCLLEAGGMEFSRESQNFYKGSNTGESYFLLDHCRMRHFGGSSAVWGGACRLLDAVDFAKKPYVQYSGWPIGKQDLDPYVAEASEILDTDLKAQTIRYPIQPVNGWPPAVPGMEETEFHLSRSEPYGIPTHFGHKYADEVKQNERIDCFINAAVVDVMLDDALRNVTAFEVSNFLKNRYRVNGRYFVIAAGGIENPRILLNANKQKPAGVGNDQDLVGRFFADHPHQYLGEFILQDETEAVAQKDPAFNQNVGYAFAGRYLTPTREGMLQKQELTYSLGLNPPSSKLVNQNDTDFKSKIRSIVCTTDTLRSAAEWLKGGTVSCVQWTDGYLALQAEQEPNPESRITLTEAQDDFGMPRLNLHWQFTQLDKQTIKNSAFGAAKAFAETNSGRVRLQKWLLEEDMHVPGYGEGTASIIAGPHHMCTTRMSDDPKEGVVDKNLKVYGTDNLYMGGSSVFATGGFSNPTFTIVQLSLRLAEHLDDVMTSSSVA